MRHNVLPGNGAFARAPRREPPIYRIPLFWMLLGPPAIRVSASVDRSGLSSLSGDQDMWNYLRILWWLFFGFIALVGLVRNRVALRHMIGRVGYLPWAVALFLIALYAASFASTVPLFCIANVTMMVMLVAASTDLAVRIFAGEISTTRCLKALLWIAVGLLAFVGAMYLMYPHLRVASWYGLRLRGESFAYVPILGLVCVFVGGHFAIASVGWARVRYLLTVCFGLYWLYLAQTRSSYLCFAAAAAVLVWYHLGRGGNRMALAALLVALCGGVSTVALMYGNSSRVTWYVDSMYNRFVVRDYWAMRDASVHQRNLATLNGRTEAASVLMEGILDRPLGYGYIGGVRAYMSQPHVMDKLPDEAFIGAHNGYLEVLAGGGVLALLGYSGILIWLLFASRSRVNVESKVVQALLLMVMVEGFFESELAYPFHQTPVILWFAAAMIMAAKARDAAARNVQQPSHSSHRTRVGVVGHVNA